MAQCLGRLTLLQRFPANSFALAELGRIFGELCANDAEAIGVVDYLLEGNDSWPGPVAVRRAYVEVKARNVAKVTECKLREAYAGWAAQRREHESVCPGYEIEVDGDTHTVEVRTCNECFGTPDIDRWKWLRCRKGEALERGYIERLLQSELAARPGWLSADEYFSRQFRADRQKRETRATPETDGARP
jgi:hypothetical protein